MVLLLPRMAKEVVLNRNETIYLKPLNYVSSENVERGDSIQFKIAEDIEVDGNIVLREGSHVSAKILSVSDKDIMGKNAKLKVKFDAPLNNATYTFGKADRFSSENPKFPLYVASGIFVLPLGVYWVLSKGKISEIEESEIIPVKLNKRLSVEVN